MGSVLSGRILPCGNHNIIESPPIDELLMYRWKANDLLYAYVKSKREIMQEQDIGTLQRTIAMYSPCRFPRCKCKGGTFTGVACDNFGWTDSICTRFRCKHPLSEHVIHLGDATTAEFNILIKMVFDIINIKASLDSVSYKPKSERNIILKKIFESVYSEINDSISLEPFKVPNINKIYGSPPFERTNIDQILLNFCMHFFNDDNGLELENALILTKFVIQYFDIWMWTIPKELLKCNSQRCSKSYNYYYRRFLMYCCLPRCFHSIALRYRASKIFGQDVLKYTVKAFRMQLQFWCYKKNIMWTEHTKLFCLKYLPIYMDLLEKEVFNDMSPMWDMDYELTG